MSGLESGRWRILRIGLIGASWMFKQSASQGRRKISPWSGLAGRTDGCALVVMWENGGHGLTDPSKMMYILADNGFEYAVRCLVCSKRSHLDFGTADWQDFLGVFCLYLFQRTSKKSATTAFQTTRICTILHLVKPHY